jgi:hypothetical protein
MGESEKKILSFADAMKADDTHYLEMDIPEWGGTYKFGSVSASEMMRWVEANQGEAKKTASFRLIAQSWIEPDGKRLEEPDKAIDSFRGRDNLVIERILEELIKLNGLKIKGREEAKNDSSGTATDASRTALH